MDKHSPVPTCSDDFEPDTLPLDLARDKILTSLKPVEGRETVDISKALHRVLAESVTSPIDVPAHTNAAVDGFAIRGSDLPPPGKTREFRIIGTALAGLPYPGVVNPSTTVSIMTGAPMPEGADTVLMQEHVTQDGQRILVEGKYRHGDNVRPAGEDIRKGETALHQGHYLLPQDLGLLASLGRMEVTLKRRLRIGLLSTGNEILPLGHPPEAGKIYDSNRFSLLGALQPLPVETLDYGIIPDDPAQLRHTLMQAARRCDVVISSGGVSVGAADYTKQVLAELGGIEFWKVAVKPGRPLAFGRIGDAWFFGLPGNPVAVMVTYYVFVLPALFKMSGANPPPLIPAFPARSLEKLRKKPGRTEFQRGVLSRGKDGHWEVELSGEQGSGILTSMTRANCFLILEHERGPVAAGEWVQVLPFSCLP